MIISIDSEKSCNKIQHPFMIKTLQKAGSERTYLNIIKAIHEKPKANILLNGEKLKAFPLKLRNKTRVPNLTTIIQHSLRSFSHSHQKRKRNKRNSDWKRRSQTLFADDMILYIENPKDTTRKLLELMNIVKLQDKKLNAQNLDF